MRSVPSDILGDLRRRRSIMFVPMVWIDSINRDNPNRTHGFGFWQGEVSQRIVVLDLHTGEYELRRFLNNSLVSVESVIFETGLNIRPIIVRLNPLSDGVLAALRLHSGRGARVQAWRRFYDAATRRPIKRPVPWFKGNINSAVSERAAVGGESVVTLEVVGPARSLTVTSGLKKSHAAQEQRESDQFRRYKGTAAGWDVPWGTESSRFD